LVFTSDVFLFAFLPIVLAVYYALPRYRNEFLTGASYVFYGWWDPRFVLLMMTSTVVDYFAGRAIAAPGASEKRRKTALIIAIVTDLSLLAFFKYYTFTAENLNHLLSVFGAGSLPLLQVTLPIGISFYTFESMSYTIDVYRGMARPARTFADLACFVSLFPHLVAGPIVRYNILAEQIAERTHTLERFSRGIAIFILGFAKKILLANPMGLVADAVFNAKSADSPDAWFGIAAYSFQIYFDFCGYSDMAVGLGRMLGFEIPKNFASPYLSESITDFWRRWHISLSTWLRDYLYIPLGGNQKGPGRTYINLALVMLLGGLWHGANWTFLVWGAIHGTILAMERWGGKNAVYGRLPRPARIMLTYVLVLVTWVFFRAPTLSGALDYLRSMFVRGATGSPLLGLEIYTPYNLTIFAICAFASFQPLEAYEWASHEWGKRKLANQVSWALAPLLLLAIAVMWTQAFNPFLYFQF
jgi:alginate O-acetyltransferase complex protein AlgI